MQLPKRKSVRLSNYDYRQNGAYYITICTHNKMHFFGEIVGANLCVRPNAPHLLIEKWLLEIENKYAYIKIDKFVIMPDHIHFIMFINKPTGAHTGAPLHEVIKWFKTQSTNEYIRGIKNNLYPPFDKHFWQRGYYEHIIRNQESYLEVWRYIDENPLKWDLSPDDY